MRSWPYKQIATFLTSDIRTPNKPAYMSDSDDGQASGGRRQVASPLPPSSAHLNQPAGRPWTKIFVVCNHVTNFFDRIDPEGRCRWQRQAERCCPAPWYQVGPWGRDSLNGTSTGRHYNRVVLISGFELGMETQTGSIWLSTITAWLGYEMPLRHHEWRSIGLLGSRPDSKMLS